MTDRDAIEAEHELLKRQVEQLQREHEQLRQRPDDIAGHVEHRRKLEAKISELRSHLARLKDLT